jgi:hypothetical protein
MTCDEQCLRELLAGVELELGDKERIIAEERTRREQAEAVKWAFGAGGVVLGAALAVFMKLVLK